MLMTNLADQAREGADEEETTEPAMSRVESVYRDLRRAIIEGQLAPGAPLRPNELVNQLGVSLTPIREAVRRLEVERLVSTIPNKGARVAAISLDDVVDVYATRVVLEVEALRRAWPRLGPKLIAEVRAARDEMAACVDRQDDHVYDLHKQVHFMLYEQSGSPWLIHLIEILWSHTERYRRLVAQLRVFIDEDHDLHGLVLDAIEHDDIDAATATLTKDLERTMNLLLEAYADGSGPES